MFAWQVALGVELLVVLVAFFVFLRASNEEAGPRTFVKIVSVAAIIGAVGLAGWTVTDAVLKAMNADENGDDATCIIIFTEKDEKPAPVRYVPSSSYGGASGTGTAEPVSKWKGDLMKKKWRERGDDMKRKWAERSS